MDRMLFIARFEYIRQITRRGFLLATFVVPPLVLAVIVITSMAIVLLLGYARNEHAIGYIDYAGVMKDEVHLHTPTTRLIRTIPISRYQSEAVAKQALLAGEIDAYVVIPVDYLDHGKMISYGRKPISFNGKMSLNWLVRKSLLADEQPLVAKRAFLPLDELKQKRVTEDTLPLAMNNKEPTVNKSTSDTSDEVGNHGWFLLIAMIFGMTFLGSVFSSSSYLLQALIDEKENRTMEIVVTSVTPEQLISGKVLGLGLLGLTQSLLWLSYTIVPIGGASFFFHPLSSVYSAITRNLLPLAMMVFLPSYLLYASTIVMIGALVGSVQQGQQLSSLLILPAFFPLILATLIEADPNGPLAIGLSLFPITALLTLVMRQALIGVPLWQVGLSLALLTFSALLMTKFSSVMFRWGMLRYNHSWQLRGIFDWLLDRRSQKPTSVHLDHRE